MEVLGTYDFSFDASVPPNRRIQFERAEKEIYAKIFALENGIQKEEVSTVSNTSIRVDLKSTSEKVREAFLQKLFKGPKLFQERPNQNSSICQLSSLGKNAQSNVLNDLANRRIEIRYDLGNLVPTLTIFDPR